MLTIAYITNRKEPMIEWFFDSLHNETAGNYEGIKLIVVDFWAQTCDDWTQEDILARKDAFAKKAHCDFLHVPPKPTVWQGPHRLTSRDYFAASNARNTALCLAPDGYIVYADDLSVLIPGWLAEVRLAESGGWIACGSYHKARDVVVDKGRLESIKGGEAFSQPLLLDNLFHSMQAGNPIGIDSRWSRTPGYDPCEAGGSWLFGCSCAIPVKALLDINGWDEDNDTMGGEDYCAGLMMQWQGWSFKYHKRMLTVESEEHHEGKNSVFLRIIKGPPGPRDASQRMLAWVIHGARKTSPGYWGEEGIAGIRRKTLIGEPFPVSGLPENDWRDGQALKDM